MMITEDMIDSIDTAVEDIRCELEYTSNKGFDDEIRRHCRAIDNTLSEMRDALFEVEDDPFLSMIPNEMSAGEADSLKETINNWRREHGYGEI